MSGNGYYPRRRGILEHLEAGRVSLLDTSIHDFLCLKANPIIGNGSSVPPGVCFTSARAIHALCPRTISERTIQRSLEHLEKNGWIRRWQKPGKPGNYPVLIARYSVRSLSGSEYRVNAEATTDWRSPILEPVGEPVSDGTGPVPDLATIREVRSKKREESKNITSEAQTASDIPSHSPTSAAAQELANLLRSRILENNPTAKVTEAQTNKWAREADLMIRRDSRTPEQIRARIEWCQRHEFWKGVVLSMGKVRTHFDKLTLGMAGKVNGNGKNRNGGAYHSGDSERTYKRKPDHVVQ